jgi:hypothetical protein
VLLERFLAPVVNRLGRSPALDDLRPALVAIGQAAEHERAMAKVRLRPPPDGWLTTSEAAVIVGVTERAFIKRISAGTLPGLRRGWRWVVDPTALAG